MLAAMLLLWWLFPGLGPRGAGVVVGGLVLGVLAIWLLFSRERGRDADLFLFLLLGIPLIAGAIWLADQWSTGPLVPTVLGGCAVLAFALALVAVAARRYQREIADAGFRIDRGLGPLNMTGLGPGLRARMELVGRVLRARTSTAPVRGGTTWLVISAETKLTIPVVRISPRDGHGAAAAFLDPFIPGGFRAASLHQAETGDAAFDAGYVVEAEHAADARRALTPGARAAIERVFAIRSGRFRTHIVLGGTTVELAIPLNNAKGQEYRAAAVALAGLASHVERAFAQGATTFSIVSPP